MSGRLRLTCRQAHRLLSERLDRPLGTFERWRLWLHLKFCAMCSRVQRQFEFVRTATRRLGE
jgi:hypothetical protein